MGCPSPTDPRRLKTRTYPDRRDARGKCPCPLLLRRAKIIQTVTVRTTNETNHTKRDQTTVFHLSVINLFVLIPMTYTKPLIEVDLRIRRISAHAIVREDEGHVTKRSMTEK